jgi:hypothetical protein
VNEDFLAGLVVGAVGAVCVALVFSLGRRPKLREQRALIAEVREPKIDADFLPGTANASDPANPGAPEAKQK